MQYFLDGYRNRLVAKLMKYLQQAGFRRELSNRGLVIRKIAYLWFWTSESEMS